MTLFCCFDPASVSNDPVSCFIAPIFPELAWPALSLLLAVCALCQQAATRVTMIMFRVMPVGLVLLTGMKIVNFKHFMIYAYPAAM